ncbi:MAG: OmpA family protein [Chitinophagales bacterium]
MKELRWLGFGMVFLLAACTWSENIQDGQTAYNLKKYSLATELLQKEIDHAETPYDKGKIAYLIGESYAANNQYEQAGNWYYKASDYGYESIALLKYAYMLKAQEKYDDAIKAFDTYLQEEPYRRPEMTMEKNACAQAIDWMNRQENEYERDTYVENVGALNSSGADFYPVAYRNNTLVFTSSRSTSTGDKQDTWTGDKFYDLYIATSRGIGIFDQPELFTGPFNTPFNDGTPAFSPDFNELYFVRCGTDNRKTDDYCGLYMSEYLGDGAWSDPQILPFFIDSMNVGTPCLSPDGQTLFFAAMDPDGNGGADIYYSKKNDGGWDAAVNAGNVINTPGNEVFPSFDDKGNFYFASDGHPGMGGLDIFSASWKNGKFSNVRNMEYPINSGADDFGLMMIPASEIHSADTLSAGYFTSNRKGGKGDDDIYLFTKKKKKLPPPVFVLHGTISGKVYADSLDVNSPVIDTVPMAGASGILTHAGMDTPLAKWTVQDAGTFSIHVDSLTDYRVQGSMNGYFNHSENVTTRGIKGIAGDTMHVYVDVVLDKIPVATADKGAEIKLNNIYYDYNDSSLRAESFPELDKLVILLKENPDIHIQINAHTDARGKDSYNERLSRGRANSVVAYLVEKGIDSARLSAHGYGESSPSILSTDLVLPDSTIVPKGTQLTEAFINTYKKNKDNFEFLHQLNRRTTFNVTGSTIKIESEDKKDIEIDQKPEDFRDDTPKQD